MSDDINNEIHQVHTVEAPCAQETANAISENLGVSTPPTEAVETPAVPVAENPSPTTDNCPAEAGSTETSAQEQPPREPSQAFYVWRSMRFISRDVFFLITNRDGHKTDQRTHAQEQTLALLRAAGEKGLMLKYLCRMRGVTPGAASIVVNSLVDLGLVDRKLIPADRRSAVLRLSRKALRHIERLDGYADDIARVAFEGISPEEMERFEKTLCKIETNLLEKFEKPFPKV